MKGEDEFFVPWVRRLFPGEKIVVVSAQGATLKDSSGKEYLDLWVMHGANTMLGYNHPEVIEAIRDQAGKIISCAYDFPTNPNLQLAEKITQITPPDLKKVYFLNTGAEAVEASLFLSRLYTQKYEVAALYGAFHGRSYGARSLVGFSPYKRGAGPFLPGIKHIPSYNCYRCSLGLEYPECDLRCATLLEDTLLYASSGSVAAFIAEPVQGTAGNIPAPPGYFKKIKKILDDHGIIYISDEVYTGLGRTGKLFGFEHDNVTPDIITVSKSLSCGTPISAMIARNKVAEAVKPPRPMMYFSTFAGNPLTTRIALTALNIIIKEKLWRKAEKLGEYWIKALKDLADRHKLIGDVRGKGVMIGVELVKDHKSKKPAREEALKLRFEARKKGLIVASGFGWLGNVIELQPPLVMSLDQIDRAVSILDESLSNIEKW